MKKKTKTKLMKQADLAGTIEFEELVGKTFHTVHRTKFPERDSISFISDTEHYIFFHKQSCCESVEIESIEGNLKSLENNTILVAECTFKQYRDSKEHLTWSFYKFATVKGWVDVRWIGESNGRYSERVDLLNVIPYEDYTNPQTGFMSWDEIEKYEPFQNWMLK